MTSYLNLINHFLKNFKKLKLYNKSMSFTTACCTLPPVESNYIPKGTNILLEDLPVYETGDQNSDSLLICVYDIFGVHPVTKQFCDKLGSSGFRVIMPDFFRGKPFPADNFPPKDRAVIMNFVQTTGSWDKVKPDLLKTFEFYKTQGVKSFGIFGLCWGAKMCVEASAKLANIQAAVLIHPSLVETKDADTVNCPMLLLPTSTDADMIPFYEKIKAKFGDEKTGHHRFDDMFHGFCGARGNMDDELNRKRVDEALALTHKFFQTNLKK